MDSDAPMPGDDRPGATPPPPPPPAMQPPAVPPAPSHGVPSDSRNWAMGAHLSALLGLSLVGPLIVWLIKKDEDEFVAHHAREALNFNITVLIAFVVGGVAAFVLAVVTIGLGLVVILPAALVLVVGYYVVSIIACVKAANGEGYRYPFTLRLVS